MKFVGPIGKFGENAVFVFLKRAPIGIPITESKCVKIGDEYYNHIIVTKNCICKMYHIYNGDL